MHDEVDQGFFGGLAPDEYGADAEFDVAGLKGLIGGLYGLARKEKSRESAPLPPKENLPKKPSLIRLPEREVRKIISRFRLGRLSTTSFSEIEAIGVEKYLENSWGKLSDKQKKPIAGLWGHVIGRAGEHEVDSLLRDAGFEIEGRNVTLKDMNTGKRRVVPDHIVSNGLKRIGNFYLGPGLGKERNIMETKTGKSADRKSQIEGFEKAIEQGQIDDYVILRLSADAVGAKFFFGELERHLRKRSNQNKYRITEKDVDDLLFLLRADAKRNNKVLTVGEVILALLPLALEMALDEDEDDDVHEGPATDKLPQE